MKTYNQSDLKNIDTDEEKYPPGWVLVGVVIVTVFSWYAIFVIVAQYKYIFN